MLAMTKHLLAAAFWQPGEQGLHHRQELCAL